MINHPFAVITGDVIYQISQNNPLEIYKLIKDTYLLHRHNKTTNPPSYFLRFPDKSNARIIALPAAINNHDTKLVGLKWISSYPDNLTKKLSRASAVILLNDYETGYPYACMEGSIISALRTAYSAVLAAEYMHHKEKYIKTLGLIGTGYIARNTYHAFIALGWKIENVLLYDVEYKHAATFKNDLLPFSTSRIVTSVNDLIQQSDTIVFCTTATQPYVNDLSLFYHHPRVLHLSLRDIAPELMIEFAHIVDDVEHVLNADTSPHLTFKKYGQFIGNTLGELIDTSSSIPKDNTVVFSPMGMGIFDIALADFIYKKATLTQQYLPINHFFA